MFPGKSLGSIFVSGLLFTFFGCCAKEQPQTHDDRGCEVGTQTVEKTAAAGDVEARLQVEVGHSANENLVHTTLKPDLDARPPAAAPIDRTRSLADMARTLKIVPSSEIEIAILPLAETRPATNPTEPAAPARIAQASEIAPVQMQEAPTPMTVATTKVGETSAPASPTAKTDQPPVAAIKPTKDLPVGVVNIKGIYPTKSPGATPPLVTTITISGITPRKSPDQPAAPQSGTAPTPPMGVLNIKGVQPQGQFGFEKKGDQWVPRYTATPPKPDK